MLHDPSDDLAMLPDWARKERPMASMLPYVSLVNDVTIRTRGNALLQCIRLDGVNSMTSDDAHLEKIRALFAAIIAQIGPEYSFYVHKVSKAIETPLPPVPNEGFAQALDSRWQVAMARSGLRDKTLTLTVLKRPPLGAQLRLKRSDSIAQMKDQTAKQLRKLEEVVGFLLSSFAEMNPRLLGAESGELLGFLGSLNIGQERPLFAQSRFGIIAEDVANTRVTFQGRGFTLDDGTADKRFGTSFAIKTYPAKTNCTMFDELNLPVDMVVTHSFTPINSNIMASRIKRQQRLMKASDDGAISLAEELVDALDDLESKRLSFGDHHMTVTVFAETKEKLETIAAEVRNIAASEGVNLVNEGFAARTHYFAQHPGNGQMRSRKAAITNTNFADLAALHRGQLGKPGHRVPWGKPITLFPTPERSGFLFNYHETGQPDKEPTGGHTLILGRPGSGKSVLSAFLMTQARRCDARVFVFDYRAGMEMAVRANGGRYSAIKAGEATGLNPLRTEVDGRGQAWLSDWLATLLHRADKPLSPVQINRIQEVVRQNAGASDAALRNWQDLASLFVAGADEGDLFERIQEWTADGRYSTVVGMSRSLMTELGDPSGASNIGALVPFFMMMFLAGGMIIATPLIVRSISGNFMMAGPPSIPGPGGFTKGLIGTKGSRARARFGTRSNAEIAGAGIRQAGGATLSMVHKVAERAKRLE